MKSKIFLISACKILKNKIEEDHNIEGKLEYVGKITREMEYYAKIYEVEHYLKTDDAGVNWDLISHTLDSVAFELGVKSNIQQQLREYWFGRIVDFMPLEQLNWMSDAAVQGSQIFTNK